ncbi:MAG: hypothetical protein PHW10_00975 [Candidatus Peribacteraceae bacterium]|nr:hypothetical protein [Candidatus Peribacteraceae bacterium]
MDIKTRRPWHRHFVALPLVLLLCAWVIFLEEREPPPVASLGTEAFSVEPGRTFSQEDGTLLLATGETPLRMAGNGVMQGGAVLVSFEGAGMLRAASWTVQGLAGAVHVSYLPGGALTVAAITTPALLRSDDGCVQLVPALSQWTAPQTCASLEDGLEGWRASRVVTALPLSFLQEQYAALHVLPKESAILPPLLRALPPSDGIPDTEAIFGFLRGLTEKGDAAAIRQFLSDPVVHEAVVDDPRHAALLTVLAVRSSRHDIALALFPLLSGDGDAPFLTSTHPRMSDAAWVLPSASLPREERLLRLFRIPAGDVLREGMSERVVERWTTEAEVLLGTEEDPSAFLHLLFADLATAIDRFRTDGYPERAARYLRAAERLASSGGALLPEEAQAFRAIVSAISRPAAEPVVVPEDVSRSSEAASSSVSLSPAEVEDRTRSALRDVQALFTVRTAIDVSGPVTARVKEVVFSGAKGDTFVDFTYDALTGDVMEITLDGEVLPLGLSLPALAAWVRGE